MATSLNGWDAIPTSSNAGLRTIAIPGTTRKITVQKDCAPLFAAFFADWQKEMPARMSLNPGPTDGWNYRESRMVKGLSNHSSGTAVDVLYSSVLPADGQPHMTKEEKSILDRILSRYVTGDGHRVLANGEWWNPPHCDGMHTEISQNWDRGCKRDTTVEDVREVIKRLNIDQNGNRPLGSWDWVVPTYDSIINAQKSGIADQNVWRLAARLYDLGYFQGNPIRGTQKYPAVAIQAWQKANGLKADGIYTQAIHDKIFAK